MTLITDDRAQALQVGAVLLFGLLIILFSFWQAFVVPEQNEEVEFNHNQEVQEQMTELRSTAVSMPDATTPQSATVNLGVRYPTRLLFANPPPASGLLQTTGTADDDVNVTIENAVAADDESQGAKSYWSGGNMTFNTGALEYLPNYNVFDAAPRTVYEHSVVYNDFAQGLPDREDSLALTEQALVNENRLLLMTLTGQYEESSVERSAVDIQPVSTQSETVTLESESPDSPDDPITIELRTQLGANQWEELLAEEPVAEVRNGTTDNLIEIELENQQYQLDMARVGMGPQSEEPELAYLNGVSGPGFDQENQVAPGETYELTVEVRNTHNVPENLVNVQASAENGSFETADKRTGENGHVTFTYTPPGPDTSDKLWFNSTDVADFANNGNSSLPLTIETVGAGESPGNTFDVEWNIEDMDDDPAFDCDIAENECTILGGSDGQMDVGVSGAESGTVDFAVVDNDAGELDDYSANFGTGPSPIPTTTFEAASGLDPGESEETTVYVLGGGSSDAVTINVESEVPEGTIAQYVPDGYESSGNNVWEDSTDSPSYDLTHGGVGAGLVNHDDNAFGGAGGVEIPSANYFASDELTESIDEATVFVVYDEEESGHFFSMRENGNGNGPYYDGGGIPSVVAEDPLGLTDGPAVGTFRMESGGDTASWYNGDNSGDSGNVDSLPWSALEIGLGADADGNFGSEVTIGEVLIVDRALTSTERQQQENRLIDQYDLDS